MNKQIKNKELDVDSIGDRKSLSKEEEKIIRNYFIKKPSIQRKRKKREKI